ncbi:MAG: Trk system potassium transporter TrkA [Acidobacteriota bacterium]
MSQSSAATARDGSASVAPQRYVVMGAGEVGFHLARSLSRQGHHLVVIEPDPERQLRIDEELDVRIVSGNGAHVAVLEDAEAGQTDLFMAVSSNEESNLIAAVLARRLGARRTLARVGLADEVTVHRRLYEDVFGVDLLLSTQLLATTRILNHILGHNTLAVEYLAGGKVQMRRIYIDSGSPLTRAPLREVEMPEGSLVVALFRGDTLVIPSGDDRAEAGDDALILSRTSCIDRVERKLSTRRKRLERVVVAGGGNTGVTVIEALLGQVPRLTVIERDRATARALAERYPDLEVIRGDATDLALLRAESIGRANAFVALTGQDERNLMASLLAQDLGVGQVIALVAQGEASQLWQRLGPMRIVSPRSIAYERIRDYIARGYTANIVSLKQGEAQVLERVLSEASPAAGVTLAEMRPPRGLIVGAVVRGTGDREKVFVPRGNDRLQAGDNVILFVHKDEIAMVHLLFPGKEPAS